MIFCFCLIYYFSKGQYILVDGRLVSDTYTDKKGNLRKDVFVLVEGVNFCGSKSSEAMEKDIEESLNSCELEIVQFVLDRAGEGMTALEITRLPEFIKILKRM